MIRYYEVTDDAGEPVALFRLTVTDKDITEESWDGESWSDSGSTLVGWLTEGRTDLDEVTERTALEYAHRVEKNNPYHDERGRFASGPGGGGGSVGGGGHHRGGGGGGKATPDQLRAVISGHPDPSSESLDGVRDELYKAVVSAQGGALGDGKSIVHDVREPDGGFTFNPKTGRTATAGFAVSPYPERSKVLDISKMSDDDVLGAITHYGEANGDIIGKNGNHIGAWHNDDPAHPGQVFLDVSVVTDSAAKARKISRAKDQIAFYDFQTGSSVTVDRNAKSGQE